MTRTLPIFFTIMVSWMLSGCNGLGVYDEDCWQPATVDVAVAFDWREAPEASVEGMTVVFYPLDGGRIWHFEIPGMEGGTVSLPRGRYVMLSTNNDLPGLSLEHLESLDDVGLICKSRGEDVVSAPGLLYTARVDDIEAADCGVSYREPDGTLKEEPGRHIVTAYPAQRSVAYDVRVKRCEGLQRIVSSTMLLDGVASGLLLKDNAALGPSAGVIAPMEKHGDGLGGSTTGLGLPGWQAEGYRLRIRVSLTDGQTYEKAFDVTAQVLASADPRHVIIEIDTMELPAEPEPPGPGDEGNVEMGVEVDGWQVVDIWLST